MNVAEAQAHASEARLGGWWRESTGACVGAETCTAAAGRTNAPVPSLLEAVVEDGNMQLAYRRVLKNRGAPGVDGMGVEELECWLKRNWPAVRAALLAGRYLPTAVKAVEIAKPEGGTRLLGIPTVADRLIQQAMLQVLQPLFEPHFCDSSYAYRPGRSAGQAVQAAHRYVQSGKRWVADLDLEKFFDRVNHDIVMSRVARQVKDEGVLKLIRRYLEAGLMIGGLVEQRTAGTPQGGPLSPLLSNILLTDLDRELERRRYTFCRYADDCNVYVASKRAAEHAMAWMEEFLQEKLRLRVNRAKSACARPWERKFLGYSFTQYRGIRLKVAPQNLLRLREKVRECVSKGRGQSLGRTIEQLNPLLRGWMSYFRLTQVPSVLEELDGWVRRKLRGLVWRQWKRPHSRARALQKLGLPQSLARQAAYNGRGAWCNAGARAMQMVFGKSAFDRMGLVSLVDCHRRWKVDS